MTFQLSGNFKTTFYDFFKKINLVTLISLYVIMMNIKFEKFCSTYLLQFTQ